MENTRRERNSCKIGNLPHDRTRRTAKGFRRDIQCWNSIKHQSKPLSEKRALVAKRDCPRSGRRETIARDQTSGHGQTITSNRHNRNSHISCRKTSEKDRQQDTESRILDTPQIRMSSSRLDMSLILRENLIRHLKPLGRGIVPMIPSKHPLVQSKKSTVFEVTTRIVWSALQ